MARHRSSVIRSSLVHRATQAQHSHVRIALSKHREGILATKAEKSDDAREEYGQQYRFQQHIVENETGKRLLARFVCDSFRKSSVDEIHSGSPVKRK
jgi:hypothetical protein